MSITTESSNLVDFAALPTVPDWEQNGLRERLAVLDEVAEGLCRAGVGARVVHSLRDHRFRIVPTGGAR